MCTVVTHPRPQAEDTVSPKRSSREKPGSGNSLHISITTEIMFSQLCISAKERSIDSLCQVFARNKVEDGTCILMSSYLAPSLQLPQRSQHLP